MEKHKFEKRSRHSFNYSGFSTTVTMHTFLKVNSYECLSLLSAIEVQDKVQVVIRQLNAKVCGSESTIFHILFC